MKVYFYFNYRIRFILTFVIIPFSFFSQSSIVPIGENAYGSSGNISYTLGQIDYETFLGINSNVQQGVQQPFEFFSIVSVDEIQVPFTLEFGPNPTNNEVFLSVYDYYKNDLDYIVTDSEGRTIIAKTSLIGKSTLNFENRSPGTYLLIISNNQKQIKTFKILKN